MSSLSRVPRESIVLILGESHNRCVPGFPSDVRRRHACCSVHLSLQRYWHSHFLQVRYPLMTEPVKTPSGLPLEPVYGPADRAGDPPLPGSYPFTRGNFASGYRAKTWTFRQYSGFGTAEESNQRYRYLLGQGGTGLSVALDLPTQCGYDSDDAEYGEEVGRVGVAVDTLADAEILFDGIALDEPLLGGAEGPDRSHPAYVLHAGDCRPPSRSSVGLRSRHCAD